MLDLGLSCDSPAIARRSDGAPAWVPRDSAAGAALLAVDMANGKGWYNGMTYDSDAALAAATGGVKSGSTWSFGPYVEPDAPELVSNGSFADGTTGWSAVSSGGGMPALSAVSGTLQVDLNGATNGGASQEVATTVGRAYRLRGMVRRGTNTSSLFFITSNSTGYTGDASSNQSTFTEHTGYFAAENAATSVMSRTGAAAATGTHLIDDVSVREAKPFAGFLVEKLGVTLWATTPASVPASEQVLFDASATTRTDTVENDRDRIKLSQNTAGQILVTIRYGAVSQAVLNLGVVAPATAFKVDLALQANRFTAWLNDANTVVDWSGTLPGIARLWVGRSNAGESWGGTVSKVAIYGAARAPGNLIRTEGDSYAQGAGGASLINGIVASLSPRQVINTAIGGSEIGAVRNRILAPETAELLKLTTVFWDGSPNGATTAAAYASLLSDAIAALGHNRFVVIPAAVPYGQGPYAGSMQEAIALEFQSRWPGNFLHWRDFIPNTDGVINLDRMLNYPSDIWHLNQTAHNEIGAGIAAFLTARGW